MLIPIGSNLRIRRTPVVTIGMMAAMTAVYVPIAMRGGRDPEAFARMLLEWGYVDLKQPLGLLTHCWIHTGPFALIANLFFLYVMGSVVEDRLGHLGLLLTFLGGAAVSAISIQAMAAPSAAVPIVGPAAGLAAVTGVFTALAPRSRIRILIFFLLIATYEIPAGWIIGLALLKDLVFGHSGMAAGTTFLALAIGFGVGMGLGLLALLTSFVPRQEFDILFVLKQQQRLREFRAAREDAESRRGAVWSGGEASDACAQARARLSDRLTASDWPAAIQAFDEFARTAGDAPGRPILNRRVHLEAANALFANGRRADAVRVYARFLLDHPADAEISHVKLIMAVIYAKHTQPADMAEVARLTDGLAPLLSDPDDLAILQDLNATTPRAGAATTDR